MEPVGAFCCRAKLKNIGGGSVHGQDLKGVGPGGAESDGALQKTEGRRGAPRRARALHYFGLFHKPGRLLTPN